MFLFCNTLENTIWTKMQGSEKVLKRQNVGLPIWYLDTCFCYFEKDQTFLKYTICT